MELLSQEQWLEVRDLCRVIVRRSAEQSADKVLQQLKSEYCCPEGRAPLPDVCLMGWISDEMKMYAKERTRKAQRDAYEASAKGKTRGAAYQASAKGKATMAAYGVSPKGKQRTVVYQASAKGKTTVAAAVAAYGASAKGKAAVAAYQASAKGNTSNNTTIHNT